MDSNTNIYSFPTEFSEKLEIFVWLAMGDPSGDTAQTIDFIG